MKTRSTIYCFAMVALFAYALEAGGQTVEVSRDDAASTGKTGLIDSAHLKDRPYNGNLPKPAYPSTERVQREFVVQYVYDYAYSAYTPPPMLPKQSREQAQRGTPEAALIAMLAAMRSGDYEGWLACWDEDSRSKFVQSAKDQHRDAAFWRNAWKDYFGNKEVVLLDRIETVNYVILDARLSGSSIGFPTVFKLVKGEWLATNSLGNDQMVMNFRPALAGVRQIVSPEPVSDFTSSFAQEAEAQRTFLRSHSYESVATQAGK